MIKAHVLALTMIAALPAVATADAYPVSGRLNNEKPTHPGPSQECGGCTMDFNGAQRLDSGGGVPQFRYVDVARTSAGSYRVVDEFFTVQIRGRMSFTLRILDQDHIQLRLDQAGKTYALRRCA